MSRDDLIYIGHMLDTCRKALSRIEGKTRAQFDSNEDLQIVLTHLIRPDRGAPSPTHAHGAGTELALSNVLNPKSNIQDPK